MSYAEKGHRTFPQTLDYLSTHDPTRVYASIPLSSKDVSKGFRDVTVQEVRQAVDSFAHWIAKTLGTSNTFETLSYVGLNDLRYPMVALAAMKCGYKVLFISPRNPIEQNMSLLQQTHCSRALYSPEMDYVFQNLIYIQTFSIAPWETWVDAYTEPYPFTKTYEECKDDPIIVLHSSGSTGRPRPITLTHGYYAADDMPLPEIPGRIPGPNGLVMTSTNHIRYISIWPFFHNSGTICVLMYPLFSHNASSVIHPSAIPTTVAVIKEMMTIEKVNILYVTPLMVETLARDPEALELLKQLDAVGFGGGPLTPAIGDLLVSNGVMPGNIYGQTELNVPWMLQPKDPKNWAWFEWHPALNFHFEHIADGKHELVMNPDPEAEKYRAAFAILPESDRTKPFRSKDLFTPHPTEPSLWQFYARTDDVIVFSSGRKWFPLLSEGWIAGHPKVRGAMITGNGRPHPVALIETETTDDLTVDELWPTIVEANSRTQEAGWLEKSSIVILPVGSLIRSAKGTIIRKKSVEANESIIEELYAKTA